MFISLMMLLFGLLLFIMLVTVLMLLELFWMSSSHSNTLNILYPGLRTVLMTMNLEFGILVLWVMVLMLHCISLLMPKHLVSTLTIGLLLAVRKMTGTYGIISLTTMLMLLIFRSLTRQYLMRDLIIMMKSCTT